MDFNYGKDIKHCLDAVAQLHQDCKKLLIDLDEFMDNKGRETITGSYATRDLSWSVNSGFWMAEGLYRFYAKKSEEKPGNIRDKQNNDIFGATIILCSKKPGENKKIEEPILIAGIIQFSDEYEFMGKIPDEWYLWDAVLGWDSEEFVTDVVRKPKPPENDNKIKGNDKVICEY